MLSDLEFRSKTFKVMTDCFKHKKIIDLICSHKISEELFDKLKIASLLYMSKSCGFFSLNENELIKYYENNYNNITCITPNGLITPKNNTIIEYNLLCQAFYDIINVLNINHLIQSWHIPLNLRIKLAKPIEANLERAYPTEYLHSDSWFEESSYSVTSMIPVMGDLKNNYVEYYEPPKDFVEEWLGPKPSYKDGDGVVEKYSKVDYIGEKGHLILVDFATLHRSFRTDQAKTRISIDTTFLLNRNTIDDGKDIKHIWREDERASIDVVSNIGKKYMFYFPDDPEVKNSNIDNKGHKHSARLEIKKLII